MLTLNDMEYWADDRVNPAHGGYNEYYKGYLENGDLLELRHYGFYENRYWWEWSVYVPSDYPIQCYQTSPTYSNNRRLTPEECLDDFYESYRERTWLTREEADEKYGPTYVRCLECGWEGLSSELDGVDVREDFGDVYCAKCPSCGRIEYEGMEMFEELGGGER